VSRADKEAGSAAIDKLIYLRGSSLRGEPLSVAGLSEIAALCLPHPETGTLNQEAWDE
jgi:hypothetical protein